MKPELSFFDAVRLVNDGWAVSRKAWVKHFIYKVPNIRVTLFKEFPEGGGVSHSDVVIYPVRIDRTCHGEVPTVYSATAEDISATDWYIVRGPASTEDPEI